VLDPHALADLGLSYVANKVDAPAWRAYLSRRPKWFKRERNLPETSQTKSYSSNLPEWFRYFDGELLLLGEPGAGKTTTLLQFALRLIGDWRQLGGGLLPTYCPIYTWDGQSDIRLWLANTTGIQLSLVRDLLDARIAVLLLDGLVRPL
jgi:hypothetical protein